MDLEVLNCWPGLETGGSGNEFVSLKIGLSSSLSVACGGRRCGQFMSLYASLGVLFCTMYWTLFLSTPWTCARGVSALGRWMILSSSSRVFSLAEKRVRDSRDADVWARM